MTTSTNEFFQNTEITGALTPEQAAQLIELSVSGETSAMLDNGGAPTTTTAPVKADEVTASEPSDPANAVLMAKDGKHTIPYDRLVEARSSAQQWQAQAEAARQELDALKANAQNRVDDGQAPTNTDNMVAAAAAAIESGVDVSIFGDFSEEALAEGIKKLVSELVQTEVSKATAPIRKQEQDTAIDTHYSAILNAHPDAISVVQSTELDAWVSSQPSYAQPALRHVLANGETAQVIELLDSYKTATGITQSGASSNRQAAQAAISRATHAIPTSLSDIPGGRADGLSKHERLSSMEDAAIGDALQDMTPEQIEAFLNRQM